MLSSIAIAIATVLLSNSLVKSSSRDKYIMRKLSPDSDVEVETVEPRSLKFEYIGKWDAQKQEHSQNVDHDQFSVIWKFDYVGIPVLVFCWTDSEDNKMRVKPLQGDETILKLSGREYSKLTPWDHDHLYIPNTSYGHFTGTFYQGYFSNSGCNNWVVWTYIPGREDDLIVLCFEKNSFELKQVTLEPGHHDNDYKEAFRSRTPPVKRSAAKRMQPLV